MPLIVRPASAADLPAACRALFARSAFADVAADRFRQMITGGEIDPAGVILAADGDAVCGAMFAFRLGGGQAAVWPPAADDPPTEDALVAGACEWVCREPTSVIQAIVRPVEVPRTPPLVRAGFRRVTRLAYLARAAAPSVPPSGELQFHPVAAVTPSLAELLVRTYQGTLDVPELNGRRTGEDVLAGYQAAADRPPRWWRIDHAGEAVGLLLLSPTDERATELTYLGLVPAARGRGWGRQALRFALAAAGDVVLNVDARNEPALRLYRAAGFREYDRREVFLFFPANENPIEANGVT